MSRVKFVDCCVTHATRVFLKLKLRGGSTPPVRIWNNLQQVRLMNMAEHTFSSDAVEEFYNAFHRKEDGRFTFAKGGKRGKIHVPFSDSSRRSYAILKGLAASRKSKDYKQARKNMNDTWANREKGQGGLRGIKGANSKKADAARAKNAIEGAKTKKIVKTRAALPGKFEAPSKHKTTEDVRPSSEAQRLTAKYGGRQK